MISTLHTLYASPEGSPRHDQMTAKAIREHEEKWGKYNDAPPGWREITEADFVKGMFFTHDPQKIEFRQLMNAEIRSEDGAPLIDARLYFFHDGTGVALMSDFWAGKLRYFAFGCDHKWREVYGDEARKLGHGPLYSTIMPTSATSAG